MKRFFYNRKLVLVLLLALGLQSPALAHVKWFSAYSFLQKPMTIGEVLTPTFGLLVALSLLVISLLSVFDEQMESMSWYRNCCDRLAAFTSKSNLIIRAATGAVLILSWQSGTLLVPELVMNNPWTEFIQLVLAILILSNRLTRYAGGGLILLYLYSFFMYSSMHMLDYMYLMGAGYYLVVTNHENPKLHESALPALYASVGFSLCWVAQEKIFYPEWGLEILSENPQLALGLDHSFFLLSSAFVEFSLGFLLIVCMLQRPLALIITAVLMSTTMVFGKMEFVGHAIVHAALVVFVIEGPGTTYRTPLTFFSRVGQRIGFVNVGFAGIFAAMMFFYSNAAMGQYELAQAQQQMDPHEMVIHLASESDDCPDVDIDLKEDPHGGWDLHILTHNFQFAPEQEGGDHVEGYGHAHLYIDGEKAARLYGPWYHIKPLPPGRHEIKVVLTANNHSEYMVDMRPVEAREMVVVL